MPELESCSAARIIDAQLELDKPGLIVTLEQMEDIRLGIWFRLLLLCLVLAVCCVFLVGCAKKPPTPRHIKLHEQVHQQIIPEG